MVSFVRDADFESVSDWVQESRGYPRGRLPHLVGQYFDVLPSELEPHRFGNCFFGCPTTGNFGKGGTVLLLTLSQDLLDESWILHRSLDSIELNHIDAQSNNHIESLTLHGSTDQCLLGVLRG